MSDEIASQFEKAEPSTPIDPPQGAKILIEWCADGSIGLKVTPSMTRITFYGLLEVARSKFEQLYLIAESESVKEQVHASRGGIPGLLKRMNGG